MERTPEEIEEFKSQHVQDEFDEYTATMLKDKLKVSTLRSAPLRSAPLHSTPLDSTRVQGKACERVCERDVVGDTVEGGVVGA